MGILVVIDMQNDFISGSLKNEAANWIIPNIINKIEQYKKDDKLIITTQDTHYENYLDTMEGKYLPVEHCIKDTHGHELHDYILDSIKDYENIEKIYKESFGFIDWLNYINVDTDDISEIELVGTCTDICVVSNAIILKTIFPESKIKVDASCCAGVTEESHNAALSTMKMCQIEITNWKE